MKKIFAMAFMVLMLCHSLPTAIAADIPRYSYPYANIPEDRIDENMPAPFSIANATKELLFTESFNNNMISNTIRHWETGNCSFEDNSLKIEKNDTDSIAQTALFLPCSNLNAGEYYAFTCKIKKNSSCTGDARNLISAYDKDGKNLAESGSLVGRGEADDDGWYEMFQILKLPQNTDRIALYAHLDKSVTGVFFFDDFKFYHIALDPLETVLRRPAYKGLIYGDTNATVDLDLLIKETSGFYQASNMRLEVLLLNSDNEVIKESRINALQSKINVVFSLNQMPQGKYYLQALLYDKSTNSLISKKEHTIRKVGAEDKPNFYIDENGYTVKNSEKTFIKQIYHSEKDYSEVTNNVLAQASIDNIMHNGMGWWYIDSDPSRDIPMQALRNGNKTITLSFMGYWWGNRQMDSLMAKSLFTQQRDIRALMTAVVNDRKNDPVLGSYYLFDEPDPILYGEEIRWNNDIISELDLNHPTYGITDQQFDNYGLFTKMADVIGVDPYPVSGNPQTDKIDRVGKSVRAMTLSFPNRPVYLCLQGFNWREMYGENSRGPNYSELRNMAYQAICEGAKGLDCYAYHEMKRDPSGKTFDSWWAELCSLYNDVEKYENIILSEEPVPAYTVIGGGDWLNITTRRFQGKSYIFAVNNTFSAQSASIKIDGATSAKNLDTQENIALINGSETFLFSPHEVKILEIAQPDYLSSDAELKSLGFYNCNQVYAITEGNENILNITDDSVIINYNARISNNAKLLINGLEKPLNGKISVKYADSFIVSVVAQDGRTMSQKIIKISR